MKYLRFDYIRKDVSLFVYFVHGHRIGGGGGRHVIPFRGQIPYLCFLFKVLGKISEQVITFPKKIHLKRTPPPPFQISSYTCVVDSY